MGIGGFARARLGLAVAAVLVFALAAPAAAVESGGPVGTPVVMVDPAGEWVDSNWVDVSWTVDYEGTLAGFVVLVDEQPDTDPGTEVTQTEPYYSSSWLDEGEHWVHVRAVLADGTAGGVAHARVGVDTVAPVIDELRSPTHPVDVVSTQPDVTVEWDAPVDTSGIAGYDVRLSQDEIPPAGEGDADEGIDTTEPTAQLTMPQDGEWYVHVRAQDNAGLWGPFVTYALALDTSAPGIPTVSGSHTDGVSTSQRRVVMSFSAPEEDHVEAWAAVVDSSPDTVPDPALARPEAQIAVTADPGESWLHVAARDDQGRWGPTRHVRLVVSDDPYVLDVPSGRHLWDATTLSATCANSQGAGLLVVAPDGTTTRVGDLVGEEPGRCSVVWDVAATVDGVRQWPDGAYRLAVVDADGTEISERVAVAVATAEATAERLKVDYAAGLLTSDDLARSLLQAAVNPASLPDRYRGTDSAVPSSADVVAALTAGGPLSDELAQMLTPVDETTSAAGPASGQGAPMLAPSSETISADALAQGTSVVCGKWLLFLDAVYDCLAVSEHFVVYYNSQFVGPVTDGGRDSVFVTKIVDSLERARRVYVQKGFRVPQETVNAYLSPLMPSGRGISLPSTPKFPFGSTSPTIVMSSDSNAVTEYLPHHEFFHQVQYQYMPAVRVVYPLNNPYWWMEASAEWGAHLVQASDESLPLDDLYAQHLGEFLARAREPFDSVGVIPGGGPEYGAFVMAEFLAEEYGGPSAVERTWQRINKFPWGMSPAGAIEAVIRESGGTYPDAIQRFREWTYTLERAYGRGGFADPDAQTGGLWRGVIGESTRPPHDEVVVSASAPSASGSVRLSAGGAEYVEVSAPSDITGVLEVRVDGPDGHTRVSVLNDVQEFPRLCGSYATIAAAAAAPLGADASHQVLTAAVGGQSCGNAVLVITDTATMPAPTITGTHRGTDEFTWSLTFKPLGAQLSNGTIDVGVHNSGALGYQSVGAERQGIHNPFLQDGWGISDGSTHGAVDASSYNPEILGDLELSSFTSGDGWAASVTTMGDLKVTHQFRPSADPNLFAVDVTVERVAPAAPSSGHVTYRRTMEWGDSMWQEYLTWARSPGGNDGAVATLTDARSAPDPTYEAMVNDTAGYVDRAGPFNVGGETIDLDLGLIVPGSSVAFTLFYGVTVDAAHAAAAAAAVDADVYSLIETSEPGVSTTAVFAYRVSVMQ